MTNHIKLFSTLFFASLLFLSACQKEEYAFGELKSPKDLSITATLQGADDENPNGDGSGKVILTLSASDAISYKVNFGDNQTKMAPSGTISHTYGGIGLQEFTITVNAIGTGGITSTTSQKVTVFMSYKASDEILNFLNGGSSKSWKLDGSSSIIVGTEGNPAQYFAGGDLADCQIDDVYTFNVDNTITYNANGATFNGGNVEPNYNCGSDRSYSNAGIQFSAVGEGLAGLTGFKLLSTAPPTTFIGTTDTPSENEYRIISITATELVLRSGNGSGAIFQYRFKAQ